MNRALSFLNLLDASGNLSITNIAVIVGVFKMALSVQFSSTDSVALVGALLNYSHKRYVNSKDSE